MKTRTNLHRTRTITLLLALAFIIHNSSFNLLFADPPAATFYQYNGGASATISSGTNVTLPRLGSVSAYNLTLGSGTAAYTANLSLSDSGIHAGDVYLVAVNYPASTNPVLDVFDSGTAGALLVSSTGSAIAGNTTFDFVNVTGAAWVHFPKGAVLTKNLGAGVQTALGAAPNSPGGFLTSSGSAAVSGSATLAGFASSASVALVSDTAAMFGQHIVVASLIQASGTIPGFYGDYVPNTSGTDDGHDDTACLQNVLNQGDVLLWIDKPFTFTHLALNSWDSIVLSGSTIARQRSGSNCFGLTNEHMRFVNQSGSNGVTVMSGVTGTTGTSSNAVGYGDTDVEINGGVWDFNGWNESSTFGPTYTLPSNWGGRTIGPMCGASVYFSGCDGFKARDTIIANCHGFCFFLGNSRNGVIQNLLITDRNLYFPGGIPWLTGTNPGMNSYEDGIHIGGSVHDVAINNYRREYGGNLCLEIGPGDGQEVYYTDNPTQVDTGDYPFENVGPTYNIWVNRFSSNGGGIALLGETAGVVSGTNVFWTGTASYSGGQTYVPAIPSPVHDITIDNSHIENVDSAESGYAFGQPYPFITEGYTDYPPAGYPPQVYNVRVRGFQMDPLTQVEQRLEISGSNWDVDQVVVPAFGVPDNSGHAMVFYVNANASHVTISHCMVGGTSDASSVATEFMQVNGPVDHLTVSENCGTGLTDIGVEYGGASDIGGDGNHFDGLTDQLVTTAGGQWYPRYNQFASVYGDQLAQGVISGCITSSTSSPAAIQTAANRDMVTQFCDGLVTNGFWNKGYYLTFPIGQNVGNPAAFAFGGLGLGPNAYAVGASSLTTGTGGATGAGQILFNLPSAITSATSITLIYVGAPPQTSWTPGMSVGGNGGLGLVPESTNVYAVYNSYGTYGVDNSLSWGSNNNTFVTFVTYNAGTVSVRSKKGSNDTTTSASSVTTITSFSGALDVGGLNGYNTGASTSVAFVGVLPYAMSTAQETAFYTLYAATLGQGMGL